jgi:hypothetical protein
MEGRKEGKKIRKGRKEGNSKKERRHMTEGGNE